MNEAINIKAYIKDMSKYSRISREEEIALGKRIKNKDIEALNSLVTANLGLVLYVANKYRYKGLEYADIVSEGNIGLVTAASRWDYKKGTRFSTYAIFWIKKIILLAINDKVELVRVATNLTAATNSLSNKLRQSENEGVGRLTEEQIKKKFGKMYQNQPVSSIIDKLKIMYCSTIINDSHHREYERTEGPLTTESFEKNVENSDGTIKLNSKLREILSGVKYGKVICELYGINGRKPKSFKSMSKKHKVTEQAIHHWRSLAFAKVKKRHDFKEFIDYLHA